MQQLLLGGGRVLPEHRDPPEAPTVPAVPAGGKSVFNAPH